VPSDYVIDPKWVSQAYERVPALRPRRHRPSGYEFPEASYWPERNRYILAEKQLGYRPLDVDCQLIPAAAGRDPPDGRVPKRRSAQPEPSIQRLPKLPPYKVMYDKVN